MSDAVTQQPSARAPFSWSPGSGNVVIRCLRNTLEDAEFAGRLSVEAFRNKHVHLGGGEHKLNLFVKNGIASYLGRSETFYTRKFVAECDGRRAGLLNLKFHGDKMEYSTDHLCAIGCCSLCRLICFGCLIDESPSRTEGYVEEVCVDEGFRGKGVGKILMEFAEIEARKQNCSSIYLLVTSTNRARSLYERQGYKITNTRSCCYQCLIGEPSVHTMRKEL